MAYEVPQSEYIRGTYPMLPGSEIGSHHLTYSRVAETDVLFGLGCVLGTDKANQVAEATGATVAADVLGIVRRAHSYEKTKQAAADATLDGVNQYSRVGVIREGLVAAYVEATVAAGNPVYMRKQNAAPSPSPERVGAFRGDDDAASGDVIDVSSRFEIVKGGPAGGICWMLVKS